MPRLSAAKVSELKVRQLTTNPQNKLISGAILSPDGKYLAYSSAKNIYLRAIATGETLSLPPSRKLWGRHLVSRGVVTRRRSADCFFLQADPRWKSIHRLERSAACGFRHPASRQCICALRFADGSLIAFAAGNALPECGANVSWSYLSQEIWVMGARGENARWVFTASDDRTFFASPRWSPDGRRLAYTKFTVPDRGFAKTSVLPKPVSKAAISQAGRPFVSCPIRAA